MNRTTIRHLIVTGAAAGALVIGAGTSTSASAPPSTPPASDGSGAASIVATAPCSFCELLTDAAGMTLYSFVPDPIGESTCAGDCAANWPPVFVAGDEVPAVGDLDAGLFSLVDNPDGKVLAINGHALYYFAGDTAPGDTNGQGVGDVWFAVTPAGSLIGGPAAAADEMSSTDTAMATATTEESY